MYERVYLCNFFFKTYFPLPFLQVFLTTLYFHVIIPYYLRSQDFYVSVSCPYAGGERIVDIVLGGTELELGLRRGFEQGAHTRNNPHVKCIGIY